MSDLWDQDYQMGELGDQREEPDVPKACAYCGARPQEIGLHCSACWHDLADKEEER
jgi:hypothetical protein